MVLQYYNSYNVIGQRGRFGKRGRRNIAARTRFAGVAGVGRGVAGVGRGVAGSQRSTAGRRPPDVFINRNVSARRRRLVGVHLHAGRRGRDDFGRRVFVVGIVRQPRRHDRPSVVADANSGTLGRRLHVSLFNW